jgi:hypothetical protein
MLTGIPATAGFGTAETRNAKGRLQVQPSCQDSLCQDDSHETQHSTAGICYRLPDRTVKLRRTTTDSTDWRKFCRLESGLLPFIGSE